MIGSKADWHRIVASFLTLRELAMWLGVNSRTPVFVLPFLNHHLGQGIVYGPVARENKCETRFPTRFPTTEEMLLFKEAFLRNCPKPQTRGEEALDYFVAPPGRGIRLKREKMKGDKKISSCPAVKCVHAEISSPFFCRISSVGFEMSEEGLTPQAKKHRDLVLPTLCVLEERTLERKPHKDSSHVVRVKRKRQDRSHSLFRFFVSMNESK